MTSRAWFTVGLTLAAVAVGGWKNAIPGLDLASGASGDGVTPIALAAGFAQASGQLLAYQRTAGSFSGAELAPTAAVRLAWATDAAFCLEGGSASSPVHELGPGVSPPQAGPCPAAG